MADAGCNQQIQEYRSRLLAETPATLESYMEELDFPDTESSTLFEAVLRLPEKQRTVIHLFYYEDYTIKEIAEILHVSESNVKVRLNRGRAALREEIKEDWNYDES